MHASIVDSLGLHLLLDASSRPAEMLPASACPFCAWDTTTGAGKDPETSRDRMVPTRRFMRHLGRHLEELALFVFPSPDKQDGHDSDDQGSDVAIGSKDSEHEHSNSSSSSSGLALAQNSKPSSPVDLDQLTQGLSEHLAHSSQPDSLSRASEWVDANAVLNHGPSTATNDTERLANDWVNRVQSLGQDPFADRARMRSVALGLGVDVDKLVSVVDSAGRGSGMSRQQEAPSPDFQFVTMDHPEQLEDKDQMRANREFVMHNHLRKESERSRSSRAASRAAYELPHDEVTDSSTPESESPTATSIRRSITTSKSEAHEVREGPTPLVKEDQSNASSNTNEIVSRLQMGQIPEKQSMSQELPSQSPRHAPSVNLTGNLIPCRRAGCEQLFRYPKDERRHFQTCHPVGARNAGKLVGYECAHCGKLYVRKEHSERHQRVVHAGNAGNVLSSPPGHIENYHLPSSRDAELKTTASEEMISGREACMTIDRPHYDFELEEFVGESL